MFKAKKLLSLVGVFSLVSPLASCNSEIKMKHFNSGDTFVAKFKQPKLGATENGVNDVALNFEFNVVLGDLITETYPFDEQGRTEICETIVDDAGEYEDCTPVSAEMESPVIKEISFTESAVYTKPDNYSYKINEKTSYEFTPEINAVLEKDANTILQYFVGRSLIDIYSDLTFKTNMTIYSSNKAIFNDNLLRNPSYLIVGHSLENAILNYTEEEKADPNYATRYHFDNVIVTGITIALMNALVK